MTWWQYGHLILVLIHAAAATTGFVAGVLVLWKGDGLRIHQAAVLIMAGALAPSLALGWPEFTTPNKITFVALFLLAIVLVVQALRAGRVRRREIEAGTVVEAGRIGPDLITVVGFNVIALLAGATVVPALRLGGGVIGALISVAVAVGVAHLLVERRRRQIRGRLQQPGTQAASRGADGQSRRHPVGS